MIFTQVFIRRKASRIVVEKAIVEPLRSDVFRRVLAEWNSEKRVLLSYSFDGKRQKASNKCIKFVRSAHLDLRYAAATYAGRWLCITSNRVI